MGTKELAYKIYCDLYRGYGFANKRLIMRMLFNHNTTPGSRYIFYMRICNYLYKNKTSLLYKILFIVLYRKLQKLQIKYGIEISCASKIGEGLSIPHCVGIVMGQNVRIGTNCTILQGVTIGSNLFKDRYELASIGNNVFIGAGAKIIGPVKIGDNVTIGANAVVTKDIPDSVVVAGNPATIISHKDSIVINGNYVKKEEFMGF